MIKFRRVLLSAILVTSTEAHAAPDLAELTCGSKNNTAESIEACLRDALAAAEKTLSSAERDVRYSLKQAQPRFKEFHDQALSAINEAMNQAQDAWRDFKNKNCDALRMLHDTIGEKAMEGTVCQLRMTKERTQELQDEAQFWAEKFPKND